MNDLLAEMVAECAEIFDIQNVPSSVDNKGFPYSDNNNQNRGGQSEMEALEKELCKQFSCQKTAIRFLGCASGLDYYYFISCMKWFCEKCGIKGGPIHKKRLAGILKRVEGLLESIALLQFVFTVPEEWRSMFLSRKGMNSLIRMAEKIIKKEYPEKRCIAYFHAFGEKKKGFNPHINIHVVEEKGGKYMLSPERLQNMKNLWIKALKGYGCRGDYQGNIFYQFFTEKRKVLHKLSYMSRPCPGFVHVAQVRKDHDLSVLFYVEMKGFSYIRYFNGFAYSKQKDMDRKEEIKEIAELAGERLKFVPHGEVSRAEFDLKYMHWDYERLKRGFYRIKGKEKKKKEGCSMRKNIFEMYHDNGDCAGFWVKRKSWGNTVARVLKVFGQESGPLPGNPPYHGYSESKARKDSKCGVLMQVWYGMEKPEIEVMSCPGTYGYRELTENELEVVRRYLLARGK